MDKYSGIIFFNSQQENFLFIENSSSKVGKILKLEWNFELRSKLVKLTLDGSERSTQGRLFCRILGHNEAKIQGKIFELAKELREKASKCSGDMKRAYDSMLFNHEIDIQIEEETESEDVMDLDSVTGDGDHLDQLNAINSTFDPIAMLDEPKAEMLEEEPKKVTLKRKRKAKKVKIMAKIVKKEENIMDEMIEGPITKEYLAMFATHLKRDIMESLKAVIEKSVQEKVNEVLILKNQMHLTQVDAEFNDQAEEKYKSYDWMNILPFKNNMEIESFFMEKENQDALYHFTKKFFQNPKRVAKGMGVVFSRGYAMTHFWSDGNNIKNRSNVSKDCEPMNHLVRQWFYYRFIDPMSEYPDLQEKLNRRYRSYFSNTKQNEKKKFIKYESVKQDPMW